MKMVASDVGVCVKIDKYADPYTSEFIKNNIIEDAASTEIKQFYNFLLCHTISSMNVFTQYIETYCRRNGVSGSNVNFFSTLHSYEGNYAFFCIPITSKTEKESAEALKKCDYLYSLPEENYKVDIDDEEFCQHLEELEERMMQRMEKEVEGEVEKIAIGDSMGIDQLSGLISMALGELLSILMDHETGTLKPEYVDLIKKHTDYAGDNNQAYVLDVFSDLINIAADKVHSSEENKNLLDTRGIFTGKSKKNSTGTDEEKEPELNYYEVRGGEIVDFMNNKDVSGIYEYQSKFYIETSEIFDEFLPKAKLKGDTIVRAGELVYPK